MKSLLLICDAFPPSFAPRMGYLCKYLSRMDWKVTVLAERQKSIGADIDVDADVHWLDYYKTGGRMEWCLRFGADLLFHAKTRAMVRLFEKELSDCDFDIVLCSSYMRFPLMAAHRIASRLGVPFVADIRDMLEQYNDFEFTRYPVGRFKNLYRRIIVNERDSMLAKADHVITVSDWHAALISMVNSNVSVICNGYDDELFKPQCVLADKFIITYTGRILSRDMQDPTLLFEALEKMKPQLSHDNFLLRWYVDEASRETVRTLGMKHGILPMMEIHDYVPTTRVPELLNESSVVLVLSNCSNTFRSKGILTTKLFEALGVGKPVLLVRSDEGPIASILEETGSGVAASDVDETVSFLQKQFDMWKWKGVTSVENQDSVRKYSRRLQAAAFDGIFRNLIQ